MGKQHSNRHQECNWQNNSSDDLTFVTKKKKAQRGASSQKFSLQTAFKEKNDDLVFKSTLF